MADSLDEHKRIARRFPEDVATEGRLHVLDDILADDAVDHNPLGGDERGRTAIEERMRALREAFPDFEATVEDVVAEGDLVAMRVTLRGTHEGPFMGIQPTGNSFEVQNMVFTRIEDGKIAERWVQPDVLGMLGQLGVLPDDLSRLAPPADD